MGIPVLILGESGSGKSRSLKNFDVDKIGIFNVASKPLPFRKRLNKKDGATYQDILSGLQKPKLKAYAIDDSQYLMSFDMFERAKETGYNKFTDCALNFYNLVQFVIKGTPKDVVVYFLHHTEQTETGKIKAKTSGKMIDNQLTLEGLFSLVLLCVIEGEEHKFITKGNEYNTVKSPEEMFSSEIDNDLKMVDDTIREYWGLNTPANNESEEK